MIVNTSTVSYWVYLLILATYGVLVFSSLTFTIRRGSVSGAVLSAWLASPIPMAIVATWPEHRAVTEVFNPAIGSWAFIFGDLVFLPFAAGMLALGWRHLDQVQRHWYTSWQWLALSALLGLAAGFVFHYLDAPNYDPLAFSSPTKLLHDFVAYPVLFGGLWAAFWPVIRYGKSRKFGWLALVGLLMWFVAGYADHSIHTLNGENLHVRFDWKRMRVLPYLH